MAEDFYKMVTDKEKDFADLWNRMDEDKKLLIQDKYVMRDKDDREEPDVDNITMNDAAVFANFVHNTLIRAIMLPEVEYEGMKSRGEKDEIASNFEDFIRDIELEADYYAPYQDIPSYKAFELTQACDRGSIARRVTLREDGNGKLSPDSFLAIDTRYLIYDNGIDKLNWAATKMPRSRDDVENEYGHSPTGKNVIITDFWNDEIEEVFCGKQKIWEQENYWKEPPFVIEVMPTGIFTFDADRFLYSGESIFSMARNLFKEKHRLASILSTLNYDMLFERLQVEVADASQLNKKPEQAPWGKKVVLPYLKGTKGYSQMPLHDVHSAFTYYLRMIDEAIERATLPKVSYGVYPSPASAVGMSELKEAEDPVYYPRIQGYTLFLQRLYRMVIKQYTMFKMNVELGEPGFRKKYNWKDLKKEVSLKYWIDLTSPKRNLANISTYAAVGNALSEDTKMREYLHVKNVDEEQQKKLVEKASRLSPAVQKFDVIKALFDRGETIKANLMANEVGIEIDDLLAGKLPTNRIAEEEDLPTQVMPMFDNEVSGRGVQPVEKEV